MAADIVISTPTAVVGTLTIPAGTVVRFEGDGAYTGSGIINGGIIQASYLKKIFDVTLTVNPEGMYNTNFSARWFGASPSASASVNRIAIQKAIDVCKGSFPLFLPRGAYDLDDALKIENISNGQFTPTSIHFFGESNYWDEGQGNGTYLNFTNRSGAGLKLQQNKGTQINNMVISGQFTAPGAGLTTAQYCALSYSQYTDATCGQEYFGIFIDYTPNNDGSVSGSSGVYLHDLVVRKFTVNITTSYNTGTLNADALLYERIYFGECKVCVLSNQGQEKGNIMRNVYCWSSHYCFFRSGLDSLSPAAGGWTIDGGNIVGGIEEFMIKADDWQPTNVSNIFFESSVSIGTITTNEQLKFTSCTFDFLENAQVGTKARLTTNTVSNPGGVVFDNCLFRLFGTGGAMKFIGMAAYMNCKWYGTYTNDNPSGRYQVTLPSGVKIRLGN